MIRVLLTQLLLFLLPFLIYAGYLFLSRKLNKQAWIEAPRYWLILAGLMVSVAGFVFLALDNTYSNVRSYTPAHMENGKLVPGKVKEAE